MFNKIIEKIVYGFGFGFGMTSSLKLTNFISNDLCITNFNKNKNNLIDDIPVYKGIPEKDVNAVIQI